jgi:hypothetical protein
MHPPAIALKDFSCVRPVHGLFSGLSPPKKFIKRLGPARRLHLNLGSWPALALALIGSLALPGSSRATTLVVTNLAKSGPGTLRTLLPTARNGDVITFVVTGLITNINAGGFVISNNLSIVGPGAGVLTILCTNWYAGFAVNSGVTSSISGLLFTHCGTAVRNSGNLTVSNCWFNANYASGGGITINNGSSGGNGSGGGAVYNSGLLTAVNSQFMNNGAGTGGYGSPIPQYEIYGPNAYTTGGNGGSGGSGGAIYDLGTASFLNCTFGGNTAGNGGWGGYGESGTGNYASGSHGVNPGPGFTGGNGGDGGHGGAVFTATGAKFVNCTFYGNTAGAGGPGGPGGNAYLPPNYYYPYAGGNGGNAGNAGSGTIYCTGACQIVACTFYNNSAGAGGSAGNGGNGSADLSGNGGPGGSGGNAGYGGSGGAIYGPHTSGTNFIFQNVLIAGNSYGYAGSAGSAGSSSGSHLTGPPGTNGLGSFDGLGADLSGFFTSRGHNLVSLGDGSAGFTNSVDSDIVGSGSAIDAMVNSLADNGGPVNTCSLQSGSPAVDAGDDSLLGSPWYLTSDARGYARKSGAHVDIGAYELGQMSLPVVAHVTMTPDGTLLSVTNTPGVAFEVLGTTDLTLPVANWNVLGQMNEVSPGVFQWTDTSFGNYDFQFYLLRSP